jgi:hypothetical protein
MKLLKTLERIFTPGADKSVQVDLKEIYCKRKDSNFIKKFNTPAIGTEYSNPDGSERQESLKKLKAGQRVRLIWDAGSAGNKNVVYLVRKGKNQELSMSDCFGRLNDKVAGEVVKWLTRENVLTAAKVAKLTGGTRKRPKLGCILELTTYPGPKPKP